MKLHLKAERPLLYLSGAGAAGLNEEAIRKQGCKYRCFSYAYSCKGGFYYSKRESTGVKKCLEMGSGIMMDSSAFSFHQFVKKRSGKFSRADTEQLREETIEKYAQYVKEKGKHWDFYINFDYIKHCPTIYDMQKRFEKMGIRPTPVYHGDKSLEWLERYCKEGYKLICIGKDSQKLNHDVRKRYYDAVFNTAAKYGVLYHGLGETALSYMFQYPWYSLDSATWAKFAAYGSVIYVDTNRNTISNIHITNQNINGPTSYNHLSKDLRKEVRRGIEENGFDFDILREDGKQRALYNVYVFCNKLHQLKEIVSQTKAKWRPLS